MTESDCRESLFGGRSHGQVYDDVPYPESFSWHAHSRPVQISLQWILLLPVVSEQEICHVLTRANMPLVTGTATPLLSYPRTRAYVGETSMTCFEERQQLSF